MDRKAWIVITLCVIGMALNGWYMIQNQPPPKLPTPPQAVQSTTTTATPEAAVNAAGQPATPATATPAVPAVVEQKAELVTGKAIYRLTSKGGGIATVELLDSKDKVGSNGHIILNSHGKAAIGALSPAAKTYDDLNYQLVEKTDKRVVFEATSPDQVVIRKTYSLTEGEGSSDHLISFQLSLTNKSAAKLIRDSYYIYTGAAASLRPDEVEVPAFVWNNGGKSDYYATTSFRDGANFIGFGGPIQSLPDKYVNHSSLRWGGVMSRFFTTLISTTDDQASKLWAERFLIDHSADEFKDHSKARSDYAVHGGMSLPLVELEPGASASFDFRIYNGAKIFHDLKAIDHAEGQPDRQMRQVMFYGVFSFISRILVAGLRQFHDWTGNWGVAIILLTICVRTVLWPIQARSNATMKRMGLLSPKLKELQEKYKDDPQRINTEMMKLYREYGVNPLGGCLPLLIQIPIFFGFYAVLRYAAELRSQPFLWVQDLSMPDTVTHILGYPLNPLPLIMGLTMFLQMKLTPQPASVDKMQQRIFMFMPFIFLIFCYHFASALALYWSAQNIYSIFQAQISRMWQKDPVLEKVAVSSGTGSSAAGQKGKPKKPQPRLGGGGTNSTKKRP